MSCLVAMIKSSIFVYKLLLAQGTYPPLFTYLLLSIFFYLRSFQEHKGSHLPPLWFSILQFSDHPEQVALLLQVLLVPITHSIRLLYDIIQVIFVLLSEDTKSLNSPYAGASGYVILGITNEELIVKEHHPITSDFPF